jgi:dihydroxyacid dehydratase/phosphogluconate dehydratase
VALLTDGRFSGATRGMMVGYIGPEAADNGPIAWLEDGDRIRLDADAGTLDVLLSQETGLPIHVDEDPLTCVVRGTGKILDDEEKYWSVLTT